LFSTRLDLPKLPRSELTGKLLKAQANGRTTGGLLKLTN
jgi:hypothetical protein